MIGLSSASPGAVYDIDASTGVATLRSTTSTFSSFVGATFLDGLLYGSDFCDPSCFKVDAIDPDTGATTLVSDQDGSANWHGLASDESAGLIYAIDINDGNKLKSLTAAGVVTTIGTGAGIDGRGMAFDDASDILYATGSGSLYTVDVSLGTSTLIGSLGVSTGLRVGLAYDELLGILYANVASVGLYSLDTTTGAASLIGLNGVSSIDGLAWIGSVPEPGTLGLLGAGLLGLAFARRRRTA